MPVPRRVNLPVEQPFFEQLKELKFRHQATLGHRVNWKAFLQFLVLRAFPELVKKDGDRLDLGDAFTRAFSEYGFIMVQGSSEGPTPPVTLSNESCELIAEKLAAKTGAIPKDASMSREVHQIPFALSNESCELIAEKLAAKLRR